MTRMFSAKAVARTFGRATFARAVFDGPVLRNIKKTEAPISHHACGNGTKSIAMKSGHASNIPQPETRKYDPDILTRSRSPSHPPARVEIRPVPAIRTPKICVAEVGCPRNLR